MTTLYYAVGACSLAPHIVLEWIGAPYEAVKVEFGSPELLAVNPAGAVPTLREDDGWLLTQAGAILNYLAQKHPEAGLFGDDNVRTRAEIYRWSFFMTSDMHASFWPIFLPERFTVQTDEAAQAAVTEAGQKLVAKQLGILNNHLEGRSWLVGDQRSIVDAYAFPMIRWAINLLPAGLTGFPNVQALHDRLAADPAVQKVLREEEGN